MPEFNMSSNSQQESNSSHIGVTATSTDQTTPLALLSTPSLSTPLHDAAREGKSLLVKSLLSANPKSVNAKDQDGRTPLFWAISTGGPEVTSEILKSIVENKPQGFDLEETDDSGWTVLHIASSTGQLEVIERLVDVSKSVFSEDLDLDIQTNRGQTALHFAVSKSHIDVVKYLLDHGASPRVKDSLNQNPLIRASSIGSLPIVKLLIAAKCPINTTDKSGWTALHHALAEGNGDVALELISAGADQERTDGQGQTPFDVAVDEKVKKYVQVGLAKK